MHRVNRLFDVMLHITDRQVSPLGNWVFERSNVRCILALLILPIMFSDSQIAVKMHYCVEQWNVVGKIAKDSHR